jgi:hypothetical protein
MNEMETKKTTKNQWNTDLALWKDKEDWYIRRLTNQKREREREVQN